jgi:hypothetical protein
VAEAEARCDGIGWRRVSEGKKPLSFNEYKALRFRELMMTLQVVGDRAAVMCEHAENEM